MLTLRPYQNDAATFIYERDRSMILASVGAGKTAIALTAMSELLMDGAVSRWLVLAPKRVAVSVWAQEAKLWAPWMRVAVAVGTPKQRLAAFLSDAHVVVTNYENMPEGKFGGVVFDELTRLKNPSGVRFKKLLKFIEGIDIRIGLTGSFTSNGLEDVFGQCKVVDQALLGRAKGAFMQEYFVLINKEFGEWEPRKGSLEKVMAKLRPATYLLEGQSSTTETRIVELRCDMPMKEYNEMKKDFVVQFPTAQAIATNAAVVTSKLQQMSSGFVYNTTVDLSGPGRTHQTPIWFDTTKFDRLEELLAENQRAPTIIFYTFKEEQAELLRRYPHAQTLDSPNAIERWNRGEIELLLAHPKSAGHGLNLQHGGNKCVFLSLPWSLELYEQAIGRLQRSGQKNDVWVYVMLTNGTVDERIFAALRDKRSISDIAIEALK
jgi:SNF2 family DNA or RNA helicase